MSADASTRSPRACSGLMYRAVPMTTPVAVIRLSSTSRAIPRSVSFAETPVSCVPVRRMLLGDTSRCTTPRSWMYASASAIWRPMSAAAAGRIGPRSSRDRRSLPSTYSRTSGAPAVGARDRVVEGDEVRMRHRREQPHLRLLTTQVVGGRRVAEDLHRDPPADQLVPGAEDVRHSAATDAGVETVALGDRASAPVRPRDTHDRRLDAHEHGRDARAGSWRDLGSMPRTPPSSRPHIATPDLLTAVLSSRSHDRKSR